MSLTDHIRTPTSPVRLFLEDSFPMLRGTKRGSPLAKELSSFLGFDKLPPCHLPTLAPNSNQGTIGTAVDYRLRYYFKAFRSPGTVAALGVEMLSGKAGTTGKKFLRYHDDFITRLNPVGRLLSDQDEAALDTNCVVMAWLEQVRRSGGRIFPEFGTLLKKGPRIEDLLDIVPQEVMQDIRGISVAFGNDASHLFKPSPILNPTFAGSVGVGGADADIIVDGILIDFKCTYEINASKLRSAALQLLGYVLLDYIDMYEVSEIMVYLLRQRCSWQIPLWHFVLPPADVMLAMSRGTTDGVGSVAKRRLSELRQDFRNVVRSLGSSATVAGPGLT